MAEKTGVMLKIHRRDWKGLTRIVVAACDAELLGRSFGSNGRILDLKTHRRFYDGDNVTEKELVEALKDAGNVNLVGERTIKAAGRVLGVSLKDAMRIGGVPHVQVYEVR